VRSFLSTSDDRVRKKPESLVRSATEAEAGRKGVADTQPEPSEGPAVDGPDSKASNELLGGVIGAEADEPEDEPAEGEDDEVKSAK